MTSWSHLHTAATPSEREDITLLLLQRLAARKNLLLFVRGRFIHDRRRVHLPVYSAPTERRQSMTVRRARVMLRATLASGLIFPVLLMFAR